MFLYCVLEYKEFLKESLSMIKLDVYLKGIRIYKKINLEIGSSKIWIKV